MKNIFHRTSHVKKNKNNLSVGKNLYIEDSFRWPVWYDNGYNNEEIGKIYYLNLEKNQVHWLSH